MMKRSMALISVLAVMIVVSIGTTAILQSMISYSNMRLTTVDKIKARYLAEAGTQYALWQCRNGNFSSPAAPSFPAEDIPDGWNITVTKTPKPGGSYEISVTVKYPGL